ncbi:MAG: sugar-binding domain-containing protein, partial [Spirochaetota bacterium]
MDREDRYYEILKTARLYYEDGKTQEQIARELEISRPTVANYLREARETGIVKIRIVDFRNSSRLLDLEQDLRAAFGLGFVKVIENSDLSDEYLCDRLGDEAARYFERLLRNGLRVGVSWGLTLKAMVGHLRQDRKVQDVEIVPLVGGAGKLDATMHANVLCEKIGAKYGATCHYLYAPAIAESPEMAASFRETIEVKEMLEKA